MKEEVHSAAKEVKRVNVRMFDDECREATRVNNESYLRMQARETRNRIDENLDKELQDIEYLNRQNQHKKIYRKVID